MGEFPEKEVVDLDEVLKCSAIVICTGRRVVVVVRFF